jgi:hypothetical protein
VDDQVHAIPGSGVGAPAERTNGRYSIKDPIARGIGHLIEEAKTFGPKGFQKRLVLEQPNSAFTNSLLGRSRESARRREDQGYCAVGVMVPRTPN